MEWLRRLVRSKTLNFNVIVPALSGVLIACGVPVPAEVITSIVIIGNILLRFITKEPLSAK